jgi:hypothetical protein
MSKVAKKTSSNALFTRFVEIGRVGLINYGEDEGKLCTILDGMIEMLIIFVI